jgi:hypothetical protein
MILITGHSQKSDGIAFVADTNNYEMALKMMRDAWNDQFQDQMNLVIADQGDYLLHEGVNAECIHDFEDECPRHEGFVLYTQEYKPGEIIQRCSW